MLLKRVREQVLNGFFPVIVQKPGPGAGKMFVPDFNRLLFFPLI
jgi:hypothetical protein